MIVPESGDCYVEIGQRLIVPVAGQRVHGSGAHRQPLSLLRLVGHGVKSTFRVRGIENYNALQAFSSASKATTYRHG